MTNTRHEPSPLQSKKFVAFLVSELLWKTVVLAALFFGMQAGTLEPMLGGFMLAVVLVAGFLEVSYIGGQAALDRYVRVAQIAAQTGSPVEMKGLSLAGSSKTNSPKEETSETA